MTSALLCLSVCLSDSGWKDLWCSSLFVGKWVDLTLKLTFWMPVIKAVAELLPRNLFSCQRLAHPTAAASVKSEKIGPCTADSGDSDLSLLGKEWVGRNLYPSLWRCALLDPDNPSPRFWFLWYDNCKVTSGLEFYETENFESHWHGTRWVMCSKLEPSSQWVARLFWCGQKSLDTMAPSELMRLERI